MAATSTPTTTNAAELTTAMANTNIAPTSPPVQTASSPTVRMALPSTAGAHGGVPRTTTSGAQVHKLVRRDSLERREAFLRGKEGSRQRRRWENDRLLSNPWAQPPLPHDWEVRPTYPRRNIPYYLAPLWDAAEFQRAVEAKLSGSARRGSARHRGKSNKHGSLRHPGMSPIEEAAASIPKEVKARLKRSRAAKGLLMDLEESVRGFVRAWNEHEHELQGSGSGGKSKARARADTLASTGSDADMVLVDETDEEDEEIVFVGRNGATTEMPTALAVRPKNPDPQIEQDAKDLHATIAREKLIFEGAEDDKGSSFARWLVHCVGTYYGLRTWSVTKKGVREAYVGVDERANGLMGRSMEVGSEKDVELPRPLWGMV